MERSESREEFRTPNGGKITNQSKSDQGNANLNDLEWANSNSCKSKVKARGIDYYYFFLTSF